ncbi:hypothetical protein RHOER0001_1987 [Rhodococcus erythropolis SK121]|nr:hypothetical protein RHOER0001_1987 [Rhodococcus erythropolis SK121]
MPAQSTRTVHQRGIPTSAQAPSAGVESARLAIRTSPGSPPNPYPVKRQCFRLAACFLHNGSHLTNRLCADHYIQRSIPRSSRSICDC